MKLYPFKVFRKDDLLFGEHTSRKDAEKWIGRLVRGSRGRFTAADFEIVDLTVSAVLAARKIARAARLARANEQLQLI